MNHERERSLECYNFSGIRGFLKKYKSLAAKRQYDRKNNIPNHKNNKVKPSNYAQDDIFKGREAKFKRQDSKNQKKVVKKMGQNGNNGTGLGLNKMSSRHGDEHKDYELTNCLLNAIIFLLDPSKRKKVSSKVSDSELHAKHANTRHSLRSISLDTNPSSVSGSSPSMKKSSSEECLMELEDSSRAPSMRRTTSKASSRLASFENKSNNGSYISRNKSVSWTTKSGQIIMFSSSSGMLKPPAIERKLECTLDELCHGCVKHVNVTRDVFTCTGQIVQSEEVLTVNVKPGWIAGTKITFQGATNEDTSEGSYPADVIFTIIEKRHPLFRRIEDDLELEIEIPLADALTGCHLTIPLLMNEKMSMEIEEVVYPGYEITVVGLGMPNQKDPDHRGDLKIKFLVNFPKELTDEQRSQVFRILND